MAHQQKFVLLQTVQVNVGDYKKKNFAQSSKWKTRGSNFSHLYNSSRRCQIFEMWPLWTFGGYIWTFHIPRHVCTISTSALACWYFLKPAYVQMLPQQQSEEEIKVEGNKDMEKRQLEGWQQEENPPWHQIARICSSDRHSNAAPATTVRHKEKNKLEVEVEESIVTNQLKDDNNNKNREIRYLFACLLIGRKDKETNNVWNTSVRQLKCRYTIENTYLSILRIRRYIHLTLGSDFWRTPLNHRECSHKLCISVHGHAHKLLLRVWEMRVLVLDLWSTRFMIQSC